MNISILTVFEELYEPFLRTSLVRHAQDKGIVNIDVDTFFSFVPAKKRIDAPTFGPGSGMLIRPEVVEKAIDAQEKKYGKAFRIFFSPHGEKLNQQSLARLAEHVQKQGHLMLVPARYEGMDARVEEEYADAIVSIGDFVLMGGDMPAMILLEGLLRLIPGVVGKEQSVEEDSFSGPFVDYPSYTEPIEWHGKSVPEVVRSGNHAAIEVWRTQQAAQRTVRNHFAWMRSQHMTDEQRSLVRTIIPSHYVALMHSDVLIGDNRAPGTTSVTSIDIHDIARSSSTYDIKNFFIVTPLLDQQKIVRTLLDFWKKGVGIDYNPGRHKAVSCVELTDSLDEVIAAIEQKEGKKPLLVATSARDTNHAQQISFWDQSIIWHHDRPVLFIFGTGKGLTPELMARCDYVLLPVHGLSDFRHLSVRSAVAIILDRWLGLNEKIYR